MRKKCKAKLFNEPSNKYCCEDKREIQIIGRRQAEAQEHLQRVEGQSPHRHLEGLDEKKVIRDSHHHYEWRHFFPVNCQEQPPRNDTQEK